ncbi:hypothetical protein FRB94_007793 [Tulasnella sp. JGI-2019a]|nr:hypothetical protein FRB93_006800 [Tulasnella sp. JGI-2019a]KAG8997263.1 hypothetical protein FRB94_007793 [Tulasnella sp. JGI-2019a]KAG9028183.1 hypothetical protein FRB95_006761 [Tulasnella sp. JGI-2019a]
MPCEFDLEISPGRRVALSTVCSSDALDMSRSDDGSIVSGKFWGCLKITHDFGASPSPGLHEISFTGTHNPSAGPPSISLPIESASMLVEDHNAAIKRPSTLKSFIMVKPLKDVYFDLAVGFSPMWRMTGSWPPAEEVEEHKSKWFVRASPSGAMEHFRSGVFVDRLFYEATPDVSSMPLHKFISPSNSFALPLLSFLVHISKVLESLGLPLDARSNFIASNHSSFARHPYIAYRFMPPKSINRAIELSINKTDSIVWTRLFFMWRGISNDEVFLRAGSGEKAAANKDWREVVELKGDVDDKDALGVLEVSVIECT